MKTRFNFRKYAGAFALVVLALVLASCSAESIIRVSTDIIESDEWKTFNGGSYVPYKKDNVIEPNGNLTVEAPLYDGQPVTIIADNIPFFTEEDLSLTEDLKGWESYSNLDKLGRCGTAFAMLGKETMPAEGEERGKIGMVKPTGWHTVKYDSVDGKYLYNRCHLIGWQLSAENANEKNLITGTRYLNVVGMLPIENEVADYIRKTGNHVLYRVTPVFYRDNLVADGVLIEALSVEDGGYGIEINQFCHNVQPGIYINYEDGESFEE